MVKIRAGKYYKTRDGRKVGPVIEGQKPFKDGVPAPWPFRFENFWYKSDGFSCPGEAQLHNDNDDLISEWQEEALSPIRTVTRKEIVPGVYGKVNVSLYLDGSPCVAVYFPKDANELREAAHILNQIAEALEDDNTI